MVGAGYLAILAQIPALFHMHLIEVIQLDDVIRRLPVDMRIVLLYYIHFRFNSMLRRVRRFIRKTRTNNPI